MKLPSSASEAHLWSSARSLVAQSPRQSPGPWWTACSCLSPMARRTSSWANASSSAVTDAPDQASLPFSPALSPARACVSMAANNHTGNHLTTPGTLSPVPSIQSLSRFSVSSPCCRSAVAIAIVPHWRAVLFFAAVSRGWRCPHQSDSPERAPSPVCQNFWFSPPVMTEKLKTKNENLHACLCCIYGQFLTFVVLLRCAGLCPIWTLSLCVAVREFRR